MKSQVQYKLGIIVLTIFRYGRKLIFVICIILMSVSGSLQVLSPNYVTFVSLIFINSLGTAGVYPLAFILGKYAIILSRNDQIISDDQTNKVHENLRNLYYF